MKKLLFIVVTGVVIYFVGSHFRWWGGMIPSLGRAPDPCELVTQADVEAALGQYVGAGIPEGRVCTYPYTEQGEERQLRLPGPPGTPGAVMKIPGETLGVVRVTVSKGKCDSLARFGNPQGSQLQEFGDEAIDDSKGGLYVRKGETCFAISARSWHIREGLAKRALERLEE
ncbi:hypothetical protein MYX77_07080 [Acidobacteriia bacterium AH_259_A11_L15]|nr:hypothetical protein [Acidobacteriia bacterium AH_259_A11_L15]